MSSIETPEPASPSPATSTPGGDLPVFTRNATGLVRNIGLIQQTVFNASAANTVGVALIFALFLVVYFPRANPYLAIGGSLVIGIFVWTTFALLSAAIPRLGGDYVFNSRMLHPALGLGGNACAFISSLLAVGVWGYWFATQGLSPVFTVIGSVTHSHTFTTLGNDFSSTHEWTVFVTAILAIGLCAVLAALGTRVIIRVMTTLFLIALGGFVIGFLILLFTSAGSFHHTVDSVAGHGAYAATVHKGAGSGLYPTHGYSTSATIGAIFTAVTALLWVYWGTYMTAEFKGGAQRSRQLKAIVGAGLIQTVIVFVAAYIFLHTVGYDFFVSALAGNFSAPGSSSIGAASYVYFASLIAKSSFLVTVLALTFLGWWLPGQYINAAMMQRALMAWSIDGIAPRFFSRVNSRTSTPVVAITFVFLLSIPIAAWVSFSTDFFAVLSMSAMFNLFPIALVGISAIVMPRLRPHLYRKSPADWKLAGIAILPIAGAGTTLGAAFLVFLALHFHTNLGIADTSATAGLTYYQLEWISPIVVFIVSAVWYFTVRAARRSEGINVDLAYKAIPPA